MTLGSPFPIRIYSERPWYEFMGTGDSIAYEKSTGKKFDARIDPDDIHYLVILGERGFSDAPAGIASDPRFDDKD